MKHVAAIVFHAPFGPSHAEQLVERGRWAASLDLACHLSEAGLREIYVVTPNPKRCPGGERLVKFLPSSTSEFRFGEVLSRSRAELGLDGLLYFGGGAGGLLSRAELGRLIEFASGDEPRALFNNFYSCDFCAISRARDALSHQLPNIDNPLGFSLADAGVPCLSLARTVGTQFDIDTPTDLLVLARSERGIGELRALCSAIETTHPFLDRALAVLADRSATTMLIGRLSPTTWSHFEAEVACRTSALVEGRGMRVGPLPHLPWLRQALLADGPELFFDRLARSCDAAWIDTRPLLGAGATLPPASERFASDLYCVDEILDPLWRAFTLAALGAPIPIVLGGHSLLSGGLYLAAEACWKGRNLARRLHPEVLS